MSSEGGEVIHLSLVGKTIDSAEAAPDKPPEDDPGQSTGDSSGEKKKTPRRKDGLPDDCPVRALGLLGDMYFYMDERNQYRELRAKDHGRSQLLGLTGTRPQWLFETYPRTNQDGNVTGWRPEMFQQALMKACARHGIWEPADRVRGSGCWAGDDGQLIWHCGDRIIEIRPSGEWVENEPGVVGDAVYPAYGAMPRPAAIKPERARAGIEEILADLQTWNWKRKEQDARLLLGWMAAAQIGGALKWRASCWLTGGAGAGKSELQKLIRGVFGINGMVNAESATPAGVWQTLGRRTVPCSFDETEPDQDNQRRMAGMIELARIAASGGQVRRGGNDHAPVMFTLRSSFMFSSILIPPMTQADRQRLAILELDPLPAGQKPPDLSTSRLKSLGACLRARLATNWMKFEERLELFRQALIGKGHSSRGADQFGVLLACADIVLADEPPDSDSLAELLNGYAAADLSEVSGDATGPERCLIHLLSSIIDPYRSGGRKTVGEWIEEAVKTPSVNDDGYPAAEAARKALATHGMRIMFDEGQPQYLAVANTHQALTQIFRDSHWYARSGADGTWKQEMRRIEGHFIPPRPIRFAGVLSRAVMVPLNKVRGDDGYEI